MPRSAKGGGRLRVARKVERINVPITVGLAARLRAAAADRPTRAPLLLWRDDRGWGNDPSANYRADMRAIVAEAGLDPGVVTAYAFRHSSICRQLLANVPVRVVASVHDTASLKSRPTIRNTYPSTAINCRAGRCCNSTLRPATTSSP